MASIDTLRQAGPASPSIQAARPRKCVVATHLRCPPRLRIPPTSARAPSPGRLVPVCQAVHDPSHAHSEALAAKSSPRGAQSAAGILLAVLVSAPFPASAPPASAGAILSLAEVGTEGLGYSQASYYTSLALFIISIPGLWSLIKRATKSKIVRRTFEVAGPAAVAQSGGKPLSQLAGEITSLLNRSNYKVAEAKDVVTFEGNIEPSRSQAAFLVFCTALSLASVALVLSITNPDIGDWWYSMVGLSPLAGVYYWRKAARKEQIQVKIVISDDEQTADVIMQGDDEEIERLRRDLNLMEKGLDYVKGIFES